MGLIGHSFDQNSGLGSRNGFLGYTTSVLALAPSLALNTEMNGRESLPGKSERNASLTSAIEYCMC
jgi:hypothetical protein